MARTTQQLDGLITTIAEAMGHEATTTPDTVSGKLDQLIDAMAGEDIQGGHLTVAGRIRQLSGLIEDGTISIGGGGKTGNPVMLAGGTTEPVDSGDFYQEALSMPSVFYGDLPAEDAIGAYPLFGDTDGSASAFSYLASEGAAIEWNFGKNDILGVYLMTAVQDESTGDTVWTKTPYPYTVRIFFNKPTLRMKIENIPSMQDLSEMPVIYVHYSAKG